MFFQALNTPKLVLAWGSASAPLGGAHDATPNPLGSWEGGHHLPIPPLCLQHFDLGYSVVSTPRQIPGYAYVVSK